MTKVCFMRPLYYFVSFIRTLNLSGIENRPAVQPGVGEKKNVTTTAVYTQNSDITRKKYLQFIEKEARLLFIPPERARGGGRSILGRYRWCYSGYLFLNPLAVDIPPIGEGMVGVSQYSLPILVTAALINQGSYCSSWAHLYTRLIVTRFHPLLRSQFMKPQEGQVINF